MADPSPTSPPAPQGAPVQHDPHFQAALVTLTAVGATALVSGFLGLCFKKRNAKLGAIFIIISLSALWYTSSISIVLLNRLVLGFMGKKFSYPVLITTAHMAIKAVLAISAVLLSNMYMTPEVSLLPSLRQRIRERWLKLVETQKLQENRAILRYIVPLGMATALDVWMSNLALRYVDVSVYTTTKSTGIVFNLFFSIFLRLVKPSILLVLTVIGIAAGVILSSVKPVGADPIGLTCAFVAAMCSASRWVLSEQFFHRQGVTAKPAVLVLIALIGPITVFSLLAPAAVELMDLLNTHAIESSEDYQILAGVMFGGGFLAFVLVLTELELVARTSALTLNIIGHCKDAVAILLSLAVFHDTLSVMNWSGVTLTILSALVYSIMKARSRSAAEEEVVEKDGGHRGGDNSSSNRRKPHVGDYNDDDEEEEEEGEEDSSEQEEEEEKKEENKGNENRSGRKKRQQKHQGQSKNDGRDRDNSYSSSNSSTVGRGGNNGRKNGTIFSSPISKSGKKKSHRPTMVEFANDGIDTTGFGGGGPGMGGSINSSSTSALNSNGVSNIKNSSINNSKNSNSNNNNNGVRRALTIVHVNLDSDSEDNDDDEEEDGGRIAHHRRIGMSNGIDGEDIEAQSLLPSKQKRSVEISSSFLTRGSGSQKTIKKKDTLVKDDEDTDASLDTDTELEVAAGGGGDGGRKKDRSHDRKAKGGVVSSGSGAGAMIETPKSNAPTTHSKNVTKKLSILSTRGELLDFSPSSSSFSFGSLLQSGGGSRGGKKGRNSKTIRE